MPSALEVPLPPFLGFAAHRPPRGSVLGVFVQIVLVEPALVDVTEHERKGLPPSPSFSSSPSPWPPPASSSCPRHRPGSCSLVAFPAKALRSDDRSHSKLLGKFGKHRSFRAGCDGGHVGAFLLGRGSCDAVRHAPKALLLSEATLLRAQGSGGNDLQEDLVTVEGRRRRERSFASTGSGWWQACKPKFAVALIELWQGSDREDSRVRGTTSRMSCPIIGCQARNREVRRSARQSTCPGRVQCWSLNLKDNKTPPLGSTRGTPPAGCGHGAGIRTRGPCSEQAKTAIHVRLGRSGPGCGDL